MRPILLLFAAAVVAVGQTTPTITQITNAALPTLDQRVPVRLQPRSMATIFGTHLAPTTASTTPPWVTSLGGIELHFMPLYLGCGSSRPPQASCDITASLIYVDRKSTRLNSSHAN